MKAADLHKLWVPSVYAALILDLSEQQGVMRQQLLAGLGIADSVWSAVDGRLSLLQTGALLHRSMQLTRNPAMGYDIGLASNLTTHGFVGYGLLSHATLREALDFGEKFIALRLPNLSLRIFVEGQEAVIEVTETVPLGSVRQCMFDLFLVGIARIAQQLSEQIDSRQPKLQLWFDYPRPSYHARYRTRLPPMRFDKPANQLRFPAAMLERRLRTANPVTAGLVDQQCERESALIGLSPSDDTAEKLRALLRAGNDGYPTLEQAASRLNLSSRTLKRRLQQQQLSFRALLDEARLRDGRALLQSTSLSIEVIAQRLGYSEPANFTRAFRKWTGHAPSALRASAARLSPASD